MFRKILKKIKKFFKKKKNKKKEEDEEKIIETEVIEDDMIVIDIVDSVLDELEFSSLESSISLPSSLSFFSIGSLENDIKTMRYNELIDSIELP
mgnify:CR=1 FL=1|tara:strand:+ start:4565 stop:4846 length:282 start_codon:yes stop_codon:yes gene_type:complete